MLCISLYFYFYEFALSMGGEGWNPMCVLEYEV